MDRGQDSDIGSRNVVALLGHLGNQLFQVAFGRWLEQQTDWETWYDVSRLRGSIGVLHCGSLGEELRTRLVARADWGPVSAGRVLPVRPFPRAVPPARIVFNLPTNRRSAASRYVPDCSRPAWWFGHWGKEEYAEILLPTLADVLEDVARPAPEPFIGVHVRRGDMLKTRMAVPPGWFGTAVDRLRRVAGGETADLPVRVWSDDLGWCKSNLDFAGPEGFVSPGDPIEHLAQLSRASALVLSRSTYSWWAAAVAAHRASVPVVFPSPWPLAERTQPISSSTRRWIPLAVDGQ